MVSTIHRYLLQVLTLLMLAIFLPGQDQAKAWEATRYEGDLTQVEPEPTGTTTVEICETYLPSYQCPQAGASVAQISARITAHLIRDQINLITGQAFDASLQAKWACFTYLYDLWKSQCSLWSYYPVDAVATSNRGNLNALDHPIYHDY